MHARFEKVASGVILFIGLAPLIWWLRKEPPVSYRATNPIKRVIPDVTKTTSGAKPPASFAVEFQGMRPDSPPCRATG